jgi:proteasome lid subunit RPN8/RPN11
VVPDVEDIATKYRRFCVLGFYHTHIDCPCLPSNGDIGFVNRLQGILGTRVYLLIMKMPEGKLGCFLDNEPVSYGVLK